MRKLDDELRQVDHMDAVDLKHRWASLTGRTSPKVSAAILRLAIAHELQVKALGGLSRNARQQLDGADDARRKSHVITLQPGMRLAREHSGVMHVVTIGEAGQIVWNDREWKSLSEVARAITGTRWSGPAFFGLTNRKRVAA